MKQPDRSLVEELSPFFANHGFNFYKSREIFKRKTPVGFYDFSWASYPLRAGPKWKGGYHEGYYGLGMRNDAIEAICRVAIPIHGVENLRFATTVYRAVGASGNFFAFDPNRDLELCLRFDHLEEDILLFARRIEQMLDSDGFTWYDRYADPVTLSHDLNEVFDFDQPHALVNNPVNLPLVAVSAACVGEPHRVMSLIESWLSAVHESDVRFSDRRPPHAPDLAKSSG